MLTSDEQRFERLYNAHHDRVAAYLLSRVGRDAAQDALARTFEVAWRRLDEIPEQQLPWLLGVARRMLAAQFRAAGRRGALVERLAANASHVETDHAERIAQRQLVATALAELPDQQREALLLIAWEDLTQAEAATVTGCSRVAFAVRLHRARLRLRSVVDALDAPSQGIPRAVARTSRSIEEAR